MSSRTAACRCWSCVDPALIRSKKRTMKILLPVDGSSFTKKALAFLVTHEGLLAGESSLVVLNVQTPMPPRVKTMVGAAAIAAYHQDESAKVLGPVQRFLQKHGIEP